MKQQWHIRIAEEADHAKLVTFYQQYYPVGHPLYHFPFWQWQFGASGMGHCIVAENDAGAIAGHVGSVVGGGQNFLINILVSKTLAGSGLISALFDGARHYGPLAVSVANPAGAGLLRKKGWIRYQNLLRYIWIHPNYRNQLIDPEFFTPMEWKWPVEKPIGPYWDQPMLKSFLWPQNNYGVRAEQVGGIRIYHIGSADHLEEQATDLGIRWMDMVLSWNDPLGLLLEKNGWEQKPEFPWFLQPIDFTRSVELNLFSETGIPSHFRFSRMYSDMGRIGSIMAQAGA